MEKFIGNKVCMWQILYITKFTSNKINTENVMYKLCHNSWKVCKDLATVVYLRSFVFVHVSNNLFIPL
jgi:hypothetical protein